MIENTKTRNLRKQIIKLAGEHCKIFHSKKAFEAGDRIPYGGRIFDKKEVSNLIDAALDFWLTTGKYSFEFENKLSKYLEIKHCSLVNSGSSANLLAFMALTSPKLEGRRIKPGDEVITVAAGFPTTVTPIIQYGAVPVFIDVTLPTYNIDCAQLENAKSSRTKAIILAHTLGNPFNVAKVKKFCDKYRLWLIEDNCDSLGSRYKLNGEWKHTGTFGDIGTSSFYPPHHITMGEGGAVYTGDIVLKRLIESFRDWGKDCWCPSGKDDVCKKRFKWQLGELPYGYDHKYIYSHFGFNLKATDLQAAVGCAQMDKLEKFTAARKRNFNIYYDILRKYDDVFILPEAEENADPSWFGFLLTLRKNAGFTREDIVNYLESEKIQTRMLFAGNLLKHPCFNEMRKDGRGYRVAGGLKNTDLIMNNTFWIGVYPGITEKMAVYITGKIKQFLKR